MVNPQQYVPTWSPDSSSVTFAWWDGRYVADRDGANLRKVSDDGTVGLSWTLPNVEKTLGNLPHPLALAWSPDGSRIAARSYGGGIRGVIETRTELYIVASDGSDVRRLVRAASPGGELVHGNLARLPTPPPPPCSAGVAVPDPEANPGLVQDCETLLSLRDGLRIGVERRGSLRLNWGRDTPVAEWIGVDVGGTPARVVSVNLPSILYGTVAPELSKLTELRTLSLNDNGKGEGLTGPIPSELGDLRNLERLELVGRLSGRIPPELGNLTKLTFLDLQNNADTDVQADGQLTGEIPSELGNLTNLTYLSLRGHRLTGEIPAELGNLTKLTYLALNRNRLTGGIPPELGRLTGLESLYLQSNGLSGTIPAVLESLPNLTVLILDRNNLSGCVPAALASKTRSDLAPC